MTKTNVVPQDAPTLASDAELAAHEADTTSIHGIANTANLSLTSHDHTGTYEPSGTVATHEADTTAVHGITDTSALVIDGDAAGGELAGTYPNPTVASTHSGSAHHDPVTVGTGLDVTGQLVELDLSEVAAGGELGGFMDAPTVDATHSGSTHAATQAAAEATAAGALTTHAGAADPHTGYRLESADHDHSATGLQAGTVAHSVLTGVTSDQHHAQLHAATHLPTGTDPVNKFAQSTIGTLDQAIANTETVVLAKVFAANELVAGQVYRFEAWFTKAGTNASSAVIRIRIGTTTLTGTIMATLTPPTNALAVPGKIEGWLQIVADGAGGTARGNLQQFVHLAAVTVTSAVGPATATGAVNTTTANQRVELTFISGNAANTYTFRGAVMYRVA